MNVIRTRQHVAEDVSITDKASVALPAGDHDADGAAQPAGAAGVPSEAGVWARIRALQDEVGRLPVLDSRSPDEILGYNVAGTFDGW